MPIVAHIEKLLVQRRIAKRVHYVLGVVKFFRYLNRKYLLILLHYKILNLPLLDGDFCLDLS